MEPSVLVPVAGMGGMTVTLVEVVVMITVADRVVPTTSCVHMRVILMDHVNVRHGALVPVTLVLAVGMAVVEIVRVVAVGNSNVATGFSMDMAMVGMDIMSRSHGLSCSSSCSWIGDWLVVRDRKFCEPTSALWAMASRAMCATCSSARA